MGTIGLSWRTIQGSPFRRKDLMDTSTMTGRKARLVEENCCPVVELRQYALHPGKRDSLIELFDGNFVDSQEAAGMRIIGQFKDLDDPDSFVWLRGFADMPSRKRALQAFYGGPAWQKHREAANATMADSGNVLLLRPAWPAAGFPADALRGRGVSQGVVVATIYYIEGPTRTFTDFFGRVLEPAFRAAGAPCLAAFVTENSPNNYPALPVREGEQVFTWFTRFESQLAHSRFEEELQVRHADVMTALAGRLRGRPDTLRLSPTARSRLKA